MKVLTPEAFVAYCKTELLEGRDMLHTIFAVRHNESVAAFIDPSTPPPMLCKAFAIAGARLSDAFEDGGPPDLIMIGRETWMSKQTEVPPSEDPNRREGLTITIAHHSKDEYYVLCYEVTRRGSSVDLFQTDRFERNSFRDRQMDAFLKGMFDAVRGNAPKADGLHVLDITPR